MTPRIGKLPSYAQPEKRCLKTDLLIYPSETQARNAAIGQDQVRHAGPDGPMIVSECGDHFHLKARKPLSRTRSKPKARRRNSGKSKGQRWNATEWDEASLLLWYRCRDSCERCGDPLNNNLERHHRKLRSQGGDDRLSNLVALHTHCHTWVHEHSREARAAGLIISASDSRPPKAVPVTLPDGRLWLLRDDGSKRPVL